MNHRKNKNLMPNLKLINNMSVDIEGTEERKAERDIEEAMQLIWRYANTYRLASTTQADPEPIWYINDEAGSAIQHSDDPNVKVFPFYYSPKNKIDDADNISYTIMFPLKDLKKNDVIYRNYLNGVTEE
jgi:tubulin--tyrosine ligase-like protein 12